MPEPFKATLTAGLEAEMLAVLGERPEISICFASDGAAPQWTNGAPRVLRAMRSRRAKASTKTAREDLKRAIDYIASQHKLGRMNYPETLARNFSIGTGVTEAAAQPVVGTRMKRAGARFRHTASIAA